MRASGTLRLPVVHGKPSKQAAQFASSAESIVRSARLPRRLDAARALPNEWWRRHVDEPDAPRLLARARRGSARSDAPSVVDEATYKRFEDWAGAEAPTAAEFSRTSFSRKAAENGGPVMTGQIELGGAEGISTILQLLVADKDGDGVVSEEEKDSVAEKLTNDANNLLINSGVVAALTLSIVFPMAIAAGLEVVEGLFWERGRVSSEERVLRDGERRVGTVSRGALHHRLKLCGKPTTWEGDVRLPRRSGATRYFHSGCRRPTTRSGTFATSRSCRFYFCRTLSL